VQTRNRRARKAKFQLPLRFRRVLQFAQHDNVPNENANSSGASAILQGVLLLAWVNDSSRAPDVAELIGLLLLVSGIPTFLAGCAVFCSKGETNEVILAGLAISGLSLIVIPGLSSLLHFEPNVHGWQGCCSSFGFPPARSVRYLYWPASAADSRKSAKVCE
jgi:hypothetical protein